jgi:hypothetical protein
LFYIFSSIIFGEPRSIKLAKVEKGLKPGSGANCLLGFVTSSGRRLHSEHLEPWVGERKVNK